MNGGGWMVFHFFHFFLSFNFIVLFPFLKKYDNIIFIIIVFWLGNYRPSGLLFFCARFSSFHTLASLLTFFVCFFVLFHSCCSHARGGMENTRAWVPISYNHTERYLGFFARRNSPSVGRSKAYQNVIILLHMYL